MKMNRAMATGLALLVVCNPAETRAQVSFATDSAVRAILADRIATKRGKGFVVAVLERGLAPRIYTAGTSGIEGLPLDVNTVFEIGSITKVFTSTLLSEMVERGDVKLDDPVSKYLPKTVTVPERKGRQITLRDLATQTSGLPRLPTNLQPVSAANPYADYTVANLYEFLAGHTLTRDIGSQYEYSNLGVGLLGHALASSAGKSYEDLVTERVLLPLGMTDTGIRLTASMRSRMAQGFNAEDRRMTAWDLPTLAGAGALRSTAADMLKFLEASLDSTLHPLARVMSRTRAPQREADRPDNSVGLGWHIVRVFGTTITWHNGGTGGYRSFIGLDETNHRGVIVLTNSTVSPDDIGFHLIEPKVPLDLPQAPPPPRVEIVLDSAALLPMVGIYELAPAFRLAITREGASLFGQATGQGRVRLHAESATKFFLREVNAQVTFIAGADGKVKEIILHQGGANIPGKRIE